MRPGGRFFVRRVWGWLLNIQLGHRHLDWRCYLSSKTTKLRATLDASKLNLSWATLSSPRCKSTSWKRRCLRCKLLELHICIYSINPAPPEMQINLKETRLFVHNCHHSHILCGKSVQNSMVLQYMLEMGGGVGQLVQLMIMSEIWFQISKRLIELKWSSEWQVCVYTLRLCNRLRVVGV